jgi:crotonobetainyl-CoA:carnitine CoA-transferase CaiB-like acyl-CoA transferase
MHSTQTGLPLAGKRVLDLSQGVAGPYCAMLLGELGADVVKVEPLGGDWLRSVGSLVQPHESTAHLSLNRNKRSIRLDLKDANGRRIAGELAARSDIVVQNFRRGVLDRFGLGYEQLKTDNPRLVYASILGFGEFGPLADAPATDSVMQAFAGLMSINGDNGPPLRVGNMVSDMLAGSYLSQGVLAALLMLCTSGRGQAVSVSLLDALIAFQAPPLMEYMVTGVVPARSGREHPLMAPSGTYQVQDGFVTLVATQQLWPRFCSAIGLEQLQDDPRFISNEMRVANRAALQAVLVPFFKRMTLEEVLDLSRQHDLVCAPINDYEALVAHPQLEANAVLRTWQHPVLGSFTGVRNPIRYGETDPSWGAPPLLGEHTREILADVLGYSSSQIDALEASGAAAPVPT